MFQESPQDCGEPTFRYSNDNLATRVNNVCLGVVVDSQGNDFTTSEMQSSRASQRFTRLFAGEGSDTWEVKDSLIHCTVTEDSLVRLRVAAVEASTDVQDGITWSKDW